MERGQGSKLLGPSSLLMFKILVRRDRWGENFICRVAREQESHVRRGRWSYPVELGIGHARGLIAQRGILQAKFFTDGDDHVARFVMAWRWRRLECMTLD